MNALPGRQLTPRGAMIVAGTGDFTRPSPIGTVVILFASLAMATLTTGDPSQMAQQAALIMGAAIGIAAGLELLRRPQNVLRVDLLMLGGLYGLLLLEFLFPQPDFDVMVYPEQLSSALTAGALGFAGLALGRHWPTRATALKRLTQVQLSPKALTRGLLVFAFVGYLHMLWAVGFNPLAMIDAMMLPRFSQPWGRGRLGGFGDLLNELGLLIYLIPPAVGLVAARAREFRRAQRLVAYALLALTLFYGFSSGTRNIFSVFVLGFVGGWVVSATKVSMLRLIKVLLAAAILLAVASQLMLDFRRIGLKNYLLDEGLAEAISEAGPSGEGGFFIDYNLYTLSLIVEAFPERAGYLGLEVPYWALVKPVPRALWPGKPEGLSTSLEEVRAERGASAATWAATYIGEAYMAGGGWAVLVFSLGLGALASWWNGMLRGDASVYRKLVYASGLFAALITMRSLFWLTTAILPTLALIVYGRWFLRSALSRAPKAGTP